MVEETALVTLEQKAEQEITKEDEERIVDAIKGKKRSIKNLKKQIKELEEDIEKLNKGDLSVLPDLAYTGLGALTQAYASMCGQYI